jgi:hypothetical protein
MSLLSLAKRAEAAKDVRDASGKAGGTRGGREAGGRPAQGERGAPQGQAGHGGQLGFKSRSPAQASAGIARMATRRSARVRDFFMGFVFRLGGRSEG